MSRLTDLQEYGPPDRLTQPRESVVLTPMEKLQLIRDNVAAKPVKRTKTNYSKVSNLMQELFG